MLLIGRAGGGISLPSLLLAALVVGAMGFARPAVAEEVATEGGVVMLALDTSLSMEADDVAPSRIDAAQEAAAAFLESVPDGVRIGVVGFAGTAQVLLDPTDDTAAVQRTIDRIQLGEGTAIGEAVFSALDVFANLDGEDDGEDGGDDVITGADSAEPADGDALTGAVVLLSDGETTQGRSNDEGRESGSRTGCRGQHRSPSAPMPESSLAPTASRSLCP